MKLLKNEKVLSLISVLILLIILIPLIINAQYANPVNDDFNYSTEVKKAYDENHLVIDALTAGIKRTVEQYKNWQGTYFGTFIMTLNPYTFSSSLYKLAPIILILLLLLSTFLLAYVINKYYIKTTIYQVIIITSYIVSAYLLFIPSTAQGIYWFNGAWYYTFSFILLQTYISLLIIRLKSNIKFKKYFMSFLLIFISLAIAGENFSTSTFLLCFISLLTILLFIKHNSNKYFVLLLNILVLTGWLIVVLAPGNAIRASYINFNGNIFKAGLLALYGGMKYSFKWLFTSYLIIFILIFNKKIINLIKNCKYSFKNIILVLISAFLLFSVQLFPTTYTFGGFGPSRLQNIIYFSSIWFNLFIIIYISGYIIKNKQFKFIISNRMKKIIIILILISSIVISLNLNSYYNYSFYYITANLINGKAENHNDEYIERINQIINSDEREIILNPLEYYPRGLLVIDLSELNNNSNSKFALYFNKDKISLKTPLN